MLHKRGFQPLMEHTLQGIAQTKLFQNDGFVKYGQKFYMKLNVMKEQA